jgi:hypothetical protein
LSARSAAARLAPILETRRVRPSKSRKRARAWISPLGRRTKPTLPNVPTGNGGRPTRHRPSSVFDE